MVRGEPDCELFYRWRYCTDTSLSEPASEDKLEVTGAELGPLLTVGDEIAEGGSSKTPAIISLVVPILLRAESTISGAGGSSDQPHDRAIDVTVLNDALHAGVT